MTIANRTLGAMAIALACILIGFAMGRLSAWLLPPPGMTVASSTAKPAIPLKRADTPRQPDRVPADTLSTADSRPKPAAAGAEAPDAVAARPESKEPTQTEAPTGPKTTPPEAASRALSPGEPQGGGAMWTDPDTINPARAQKSEQQQERPAEPRASDRFTDGQEDDMATLTSGTEGFERCRRKYRSFDPADGTYRPYGQDTRAPCPYLAR